MVGDSLMGIVLMFMILASITPYLFYQLNIKSLAGMQLILVLGMWLYFVDLAFIGVTPPMFSIKWMAFYLCLVVAEVAWVMFIIHLVKSAEKTKKLKDLITD